MCSLLCNFMHLFFSFASRSPRKFFFDRNGFWWRFIAYFFALLTPGEWTFARIQFCEVLAGVHNVLLVCLRTQSQSDT